MKEKKEKQLTEFNTDDKKDFIKFFCIMGAMALLDILGISALTARSIIPLYFSLPVFGFATLGVYLQEFNNYGEGLKNYIFSKKYKAKYYKEMEDKIARVEDYIYSANEADKLYFELKNNPSTPAKFLNEIRMEAYEKALQAQMVINVHNQNLTPNQKYFNDMILQKQELRLNVNTYLPSFDLTEDNAFELKEYYNKLENKLKDNCDVRCLINIEKYKRTPKENGSNQTERQYTVTNNNSVSKVKTDDKVKADNKDLEM